MPTVLRAAAAGLFRGAGSLSALLGAGAVCVMTSTASAQVEAQQQVSDRIRILGDDAFHWTQDGTRTLMIEKNVQIITDDTTMTAERAVLWLSGDPKAGNYSVQIALLGGAKVTRGDVVREAPELFVTSDVRPDVKLEVVNLSPQSKVTDVHYLAATQLRRRAAEQPTQPADAAATPGNPTTTDPAQPTPSNGTGLAATTSPTTGPAATRPIRLRSSINFRYDRARMEKAENGNIAMVLSGNVGLFQTKEDGSRTELQAQNVVVFTKWTNIRELFEGDKLRAADAERDIEAVYFEGDVQIDATPVDRLKPEQTLRASRAVYNFDTEQAILTDALLHSYDPKMPAPLVVRAESMKKLGTDSFEASRASVSTSSFAQPGLKLSAKKVTVREEPKKDKDDPSRTAFKAVDVMPQLYGIPFFWLPRVWGTADGSGSGTPLRDIQLSDTTAFGFGVETKWGLFQTLGIEPPPGLDAQYRLDYYSERGPGFGVDASYSGGFVDEATLQPWNYTGSLTAYGAIDDGTDRLGKQRSRIKQDEEFRGRVKWQHQQFLTDNWQLQARVGYTSDATFIEEWFRNEFRNGLEQDASLYLKRSQGSEVLSGLVSYNISQTATVADQLQEVSGTGNQNQLFPVTVDRLPELQYHRIGESVLDDRMTLLSNNSVAGLHFNESKYPRGLIDGDGFGLRNVARTPTVNDADVGIPSYAYTGVTNDYVARGDFRQELDYPLGDDKVRLVPYGVVRYTAYSDSPEDGATDRILGGVGVRASTQFHRVYNGVQSDVLDIHRLRHVIEPQMHLFASAASRDREELYQYDEGVDGISDIMAANFNVRQRFQTKRGGPGRQRSVDFLTTNTGVVFFANQPDEIVNPASNPNFATADAFRGTFYGSMPEASIPRSTAYADAAWRVTDTTAVLGDIAMNIDKGNLATSAVGLAVSRDPRTRYYAGVRYIGETNSTIGTFTFDYEISERYIFSFNQSFNFTEETSQSTNIQIIRKFEQFVFTLTLYLDQIEDEGGIQFTITPRNLPFAMGIGDGAGGRR